MAKSMRTSRFRYYPLRRFPITWIKKMVNKEVEKQIAELRSDFLLMHLSQREEMVDEIQEQLRKLVIDEVIPRPPYYTQLDKDCMTSKWMKKMEEEYAEDTDEDEEDEDKSLRPKRPQKLGYRVFETLSDTDSICLAPINSDSSDDYICNVFSDAHTSSQSNHKFSSDVKTDASQVMKELEEEISSNLFQTNPSFRASNIRHEDERIQADKIKEEDASLMESQWKEWMDTQEIKGNHKAKPSEQQGEAAPQVTETQIWKPLKPVDTMNKMKTRLCDFFNPHMSHRWERFEDED